MSDLFRRLLSQRYQQLKELDEHIDGYTREVQLHSCQSEACQRLQTAPGFGPIIASAFHGAMGNAEAFRRGRDVSASLGIVPRQHSSGGKEQLLGISKRGDTYLCSLLIHGARSVVRWAQRKDDKLSRWINTIRAERGFNKAVVAMANKMAWIG
ncbi:MAG: transposase [Pseudomonadota bacterium]